MRNRYYLLHLKLFFTILRKQRVNFKKLYNAFLCQIYYLLGHGKSAKSALMVSLELCNECNINCLFCRDESGNIYDQNPAGIGLPMPKGRMPFELYKSIIDQVKDYVLLAVLYTNGEPLMYKDIIRCIRYASERKVATVISTNGILLTEEKITEMLEAGLDFIKIQLSGFTQEIYSKQVRGGDVEKVKSGIQAFDRLNRLGSYGTLIMVDYILYNYNRHELPLIQKFCENMSVILSVRPGNPAHGFEDVEPPLFSEALPLKTPCDWLWKAIQVDHNGHILPCCECSVWSGVNPFAKNEIGKADLLKVWNGPNAVNMRKTIVRKGRGAIPLCSACTRKGISFKW